MTRSEIAVRLLAMLAAVAEDREEDLDLLTDDLEVDDLLSVIRGLALLTLRGITSPHMDPQSAEAKRQKLAAIRTLLLTKQAEAQ